MGKIWLSVKFWALTNVVLKVFDVLSTWYVVTQNNISLEGNPLMRNAMSFYGLEPTLAMAFAAHLLIVYLWYRKRANNYKSALKLLIFTAVLLLVVCINNGIVMLLLL